MSGPYVYVPEASYQQNAYYNAGQASPYGSPFVPTVGLQGASPYSNPASLPPSPRIGGAAIPPGGLLFPGMQGGADPVWDSAYRRPRQNSWHGVYNPGGLLSAGPAPGHARSNSFGQADAPFYPPPVSPGYYGQPPPATAPVWNTNWNPNQTSPWYNRILRLPGTRQEQELHIHPWLNGEHFRSDFFFNIAIPTFAPMRVVGPQGQTAFLEPEQLSQFATFPHIHKLTITCEPIGQFPIELVYTPPNPYAAQNLANIPPITVGDVLMKIHGDLHKPITQYDWGGLSTREEEEVTRAYLKRCKSAGPQAEGALRSQGVKRVDFLKKNVMFRGLVRDGSGLEKMKLIVGPA